MKSLLFVCGLLALAALTMAETDLALRTKLSGQTLPVAGSQCYKLTLDDPTVQDVVWWEAGKLMIRLDPCQGFPHLKVSVYGCPSTTGKVVYEFMSTKMMNDAQSAGKPMPASWEWPGDVETLTIDITHKTYYIEVFNDDTHRGAGELFSSTPAKPAVYELYTDIFDANRTTTPNKMEHIFDLKYTTPWDKKVARMNESDNANSFSFGGGATSNIVTITWWPPGLPGSASIETIKAESYEYAVFIHEITDNIGTSVGKSNFANVVESPSQNICPGSDSNKCTPSNCRSCANDFPDCPKEFLTNCDETTLNVEKLKKALANDTLPFEAHIKNAQEYTAWTVCGAQTTMSYVDSSRAYTVITPDTRPTTNIEWFSHKSAQLAWTPSGQLSMAISGLKDDKNNVYLINVLTRKASTTTDTKDMAAYEFMTLQMQTPRYQTPELQDRDYAVIIGVSVGLGFCIIIFVVVAIIVRQRRKKRLQQRIRMKK